MILLKGILKLVASPYIHAWIY